MEELDKSNSNNVEEDKDIDGKVDDIPTSDSTKRLDENILKLSRIKSLCHRTDISALAKIGVSTNSIQLVETIKGLKSA